MLSLHEAYLFYRFHNNVRETTEISDKQYFEL